MERLRAAGPAAIVTLWTSTAAAMHFGGLGLLDAEPISYVGTLDASRLWFQAGLIIGAVLLIAFSIAVHVGDATPRLFLAACLVGQAAQIVAAVVPISGSGLGHRVHTVAGITLGLSLPVLISCYAASRSPGRWRRICWALASLEFAACVAGVALSRAGRAPLAEILPASGYHLWIGIVAAHAPSPAARHDRGARTTTATH